MYVAQKKSQFLAKVDHRWPQQQQQQQQPLQLRYQQQRGLTGLHSASAQLHVVEALNSELDHAVEKEIVKETRKKKGNVEKNPAVSLKLILYNSVL